MAEKRKDAALGQPADNAAEEALRVRGLCRRRHGFALRDISFTLERGYILGLVGKNGAGKTTLLQSLLHPEDVNEGELRIFGRDIRKEPLAARQELGVLMEEQPFLWNYSLIENGRLLGRFYPRFEEERFVLYLKRFELPAGKVYAELSAGMRMKFQLAFALAHRPRVILMDEATGGLDVVFRREFFYLLQEAVEQEMLSVVIATHVTEDLDRVADYVAWIEDGKLQFCCSKEELYGQYEEFLQRQGRAGNLHELSNSAKLGEIIYHYKEMQT